MSEEHRIRKKRFQIWLLDEEHDLLRNKALAANLSKSDYLRSVILYASHNSGIKLSKEDAAKLRYELNAIGNNINQIAFQVNSKRSVNENEFANLYEQYINLLAAYSEIVG